MTWNNSASPPSSTLDLTTHPPSPRKGEGRGEGRGQGFTPLFDEISDSCGFVAAAAYGIIWRYSQMRDGVCRASVATLAARLNISESTIKRHLKMLTDTGYLVDRTPNLRNRPHIYQPGSKFTRQPAPEPILPDDDDDTEDIPPAGRSERTTSPETGRSERPTTRSERPTRWVTENYPGMAESTMSDTSLRDNRRNLKEDTDSPSSKAKKLWEPILQNLKSQASKSFYEEYLQPITPHSWDGTTLTLTVPDPGLAEIIQSRAGIQATRFLRAISANSDAGILILSPKPTHSASTDR